MKSDRAAVLSHLDRLRAISEGVVHELARFGLTDPSCIVAYRAALEQSRDPATAWDTAHRQQLIVLRDAWLNARGETRRRDDAEVLMFNRDEIAQRMADAEQKFWAAAELTNPFRANVVQVAA